MKTWLYRVTHTSCYHLLSLSHQINKWLMETLVYMRKKISHLLLFPPNGGIGRILELGKCWWHRGNPGGKVRMDSHCQWLRGSHDRAQRVGGGVSPSVLNSSSFPLLSSCTLFRISHQTRTHWVFEALSAVRSKRLCNSPKGMLLSVNCKEMNTFFHFPLCTRTLGTRAKRTL